jgi:hypothetical protein
VFETDETVQVSLKFKRNFEFNFEFVRHSIAHSLTSDLAACQLLNSGAKNLVEELFRFLASHDANGLSKATVLTPRKLRNVFARELRHSNASSTVTLQ